jgi:hypothetical protein
MFASESGPAVEAEPWPGATEDDWREWETGDPSALIPTMANTAPSGLFALELDTALRGDLTGVSAADLVDAAIGYERIAAWAAAQQARVLAEFAHRPADGTIVPAATREPRAFAAEEVALALTLAPRVGAERLQDAQRLAGALRLTRDALAAGRICAGRARLICRMLAEHDDEITTAVQARVLPEAGEQTWSQLRAAITKALLLVEPDQAERHSKAKRRRSVELYPGQDGMASLVATLTATDATACFAWLTRLARGIEPDHPDQGAGSMDRRRADVLVALLTGRLVATRDNTAEPTEPASDDQPRPVHAVPVGALRPLVQVVVPITTLLGVGNEPAELAGYGPIPAHLVREIAADPNSTWQRLLTDPASGRLLDVGRTRYRPPPGMAAFVRARDGECRQPTCRRTATACELDHVTEWQHGGHTSEDNLCALCARHHDLKEHHGWQVVLHDDRTLEWTTPTGHRYTSRPVDHRIDGPPPTLAPTDRPPAVNTAALISSGTGEDGTAPF